MIQIKLLKDWRSKKAGDIINISKKGGDSAVLAGVAEYLDKEKEIKKGVHKFLAENYFENASYDEKEDIIKIGDEKKSENPIAKAIQVFVDKRDLAKQFLKIQPFYYDKNKLWWMWDTKQYKWVLTDETDILNGIALSSSANTINSKEKTEILEALKQEARLHKPKDIKPTWIQFKDSIVDVQTGEEFKASPEYFVTNPIPWNLNKDRFVDTPIMDKIFEEWVGEKYVKTLYEIIAYSLLPNYPIHRLFCFIGEGLNGKCQKGSDKVLMSNGKWKEIKDIKKGDEVISPQKDGSYKFSKVINVHKRFEEEVYEVREKKRQKRVLYTCAGNHIIPIIRTWTKRTTKDDSTPRIMKRKLFEYDAHHISKLKNNKSQICSFSTTAIGYNKKDAEINPYCLGAWLGDGHFSIRKVKKKGKDKRRWKLNNGKYVLGRNLGITSMDKEVINEFFLNYKKDMNSITHKKKNLASTYHMNINGKFAKQLIRLKLDGKGSGEKFIPKECLLSSIKYRKELLAGLIDTDGFVQKKIGAVYYTTKSKQLAEDVKNLVFSLGGYCNIRNVEKKSQSGFKGNYFELSIQFQNYDIPLRVKRKKERLLNRKFSPRNIAIECVKTNPQNVYGIEIEGSSNWYITNNWMVTHNSKFLQLLTNFIGRENVTSTELDTLLTSRFEITRLHKKLVCIMGETNFSEINKTSILKKLTGQDVIGFEYKNKNPFDDYNYAKILIATNNLPATTDKTIGFYRRWLIIDFPNRFSEEKDILEDIPDEEYEILAVKSTILLKDLLKKKKFYNEGTIEEREKKYEEKSNPFDKFLKEFTDDSDPDAHIFKWEFKKVLDEWLKENRFRGMSERTIYNNMKEKNIIDDRVYVDFWEDNQFKKKQVRAWIGIKWRENDKNNKK